MPRFAARRFHLFLITVVMLIGAACGSSPAAPASPILQPGPYHLRMTGFATSTDPAVPACLPPVTALTDVRAYLDLSSEGAIWIGRTTTQLGDLELTIQGKEDGAAGFDVSGSIRGTAIDTAYPLARRGMFPQFALTIKVGAATGTAAAVEGVSERTGRYASGTISGDIQYFDGLGNITKCTAVVWTLEPVPS